MSNYIKYIGKISNEELENQNVFYVQNEIGEHCIFIKNSESIVGVDKPAYCWMIKYKTNVKLNFEDNKKSIFCHIIICSDKTNDTTEKFKIMYEYLFKKITKPLNDFEIQKLMISLSELFEKPYLGSIDSTRKGIYGELLFILKSLEHNSNLISKYHSNFYSKHDLEIDYKNRIEIKTSISQNRIHTFSHDQIFRQDVKVFVVSILLEESDEGVSLYDLFNIIKEKNIDYEAQFKLQKILNITSVSKEDKGPKFSLEKALDEIKIFESNNLPKLDIIKTNGVTNIRYDVDCSFAKEIKFEDFIKILKSKNL